MIRLLCCFALFPLLGFGNPKDDLLNKFAKHAISDHFIEAHQDLNKWEESYTEDFHIVNVCRAFLLLRDSLLEESISLFEELT